MNFSKNIKFIFNQTPYNYGFRKQLLIGASLGGIVTFVMIFLQPFGVYQFESDFKFLIFLGFGILLAALYILWARAENLWYNYKNKHWKVSYEIISFILFMVIASIPIHFYNQVFLNNLFNSKFHVFEYVNHWFWFLKNSIIPIMLILFPFYSYLRNKFGELFTLDSLNEIDIYGINKGEKITLKKEDLLFVKSSENYVDIYYTKNDEIQNITFRNTLTSIKKQASFLQKSHRSYLVNLSVIKEIKGNSQNAKITFYKGDLEAPLSKSYYKAIKSALEV